MDNLDNIKQKSERKNQRSFFTFFIFLIISTAAWLLVKLSEDYSTQTSFHLRFADAPTDQWVSSDNQSVNMSLNVDGFHTLRYKMIREPNRFVTVSLGEVPYRKETGNTYSFSSQYMAEKVAERLGVNASDITMNDGLIYFTMDPLKSKVVPVAFCSDLKMQRQYGLYGIPTIDPATVTIFGPEEVIDTLRAVRTEKVSKSNVSESFSESAPLDMMGGKIRCNTQEVRVTVEVEKYTEMDVEVPIRFHGKQEVRFFPETLSVKCLVAMKDYANIVPDDFTVDIDKKQLEALQPLLDVHLATWPNTIQILSTHPDKVEYLIVQ
jgi:hypothetical protein